MNVDPLEVDLQSRTVSVLLTGPDDHSGCNINCFYFSVVPIWPHGSKHSHASGVNYLSSPAHIPLFQRKQMQFLHLEIILWHDSTWAGANKKVTLKKCSWHKLKCLWHLYLLGNVDMHHLYWKLLLYFRNKFCNLHKYMNAF